MRIFGCTAEGSANKLGDCTYRDDITTYCQTQILAKPLYYI